MTMKLIKRSIAFGIACALLICSAVTAAAQPTVTLLDSSADGVSAFIGVSENIFWAQKFTMPDNGISYQIAGLTICNIITIFNSGTPTANISLWSAVNGVPGSEIGVICAQGIDHDGIFPFNPSVNLQLSSGLSYFIQFDAPNGFWELTGTTLNGATGLGTFGPLFEQINGGWTPYDMAASMELIAVPVPEPPASMLLLLGIIATGVCGCRHGTRK